MCILLMWIFVTPQCSTYRGVLSLPIHVSHNAPYAWHYFGDRVVRTRRFIAHLIHIGRVRLGSSVLGRLIHLRRLWDEMRWDELCWAIVRLGSRWGRRKSFTSSRWRGRVSSSSELIRNVFGWAGWGRMTHPDLAEPNRTRHPKTEESS